MSDSESQIVPSEQQKSKLKIINDLIQKRNADKINAIKEYQDIQAKLQKQENKVSKKFKYEYPCIQEDCDKGYTYFITRKRHIVQKHKSLAYQLEYITYFCQICDDYGTNIKRVFEQHQEKCMEEHIANYRLQGFKIEESKLTADQEILYQKAKKFNN